MKIQICKPCESCDRETDDLYVLGKRTLCNDCYEDEIRNGSRYPRMVMCTRERLAWRRGCLSIKHPG